MHHLEWVELKLPPVFEQLTPRVSRIAEENILIPKQDLLVGNFLGFQIRSNLDDIYSHILKFQSYCLKAESVYNLLRDYQERV